MHAIVGNMKRVTITIPDDLAQGLDKYIAEEGATATRASVIEGALREYLTLRGYLGPHRALRITPAACGSGLKDVSVNHDRYLAEDQIRKFKRLSRGSRRSQIDKGR